MRLRSWIVGAALAAAARALPAPVAEAAGQSAAASSPAKAESAASSHQQLLHVLQSERLFAARSKAGQPPWDLRTWLSKATGLAAHQLEASVEQLERSRRPPRSKRGRGRVTHAAASAKYIAPLESPVVAAALSQVRAFLRPHTRRTLKLLESVGQPVDESLWQI